MIVYTLIVSKYLRVETKVKIVILNKLADRFYSILDNLGKQDET